MRIFLSYSHADRKLAATLRKRLEAEDLTVSSFDEDPSTSNWHRDLEAAIRSASAILLLINARAKVEDPQRVAWRLALEAVWADPSKRLIPVLLQDAELPAFVKSASAGGEVQAIRLRESQGLDLVVKAILRILRDSRDQLAVKKRDAQDVISDPPDRKQPRSYDVIPDPGGKQGYAVPEEVFDVIPDAGPIETYPTVTDEDRARKDADFAAIREYAEQLKH